MSSTAAAEQRAAALRDAYVAACRLELRALKPGNVHDFADGHGMTVAQFEASALASADALGAPGTPVGRRILDAVAATQRVAACNTNLGIVLLAAPLLAAAERADAAGLRPALAAVLAGLTQADAENAYAAIRLARPAGLGQADREDVAAAPSVDLRQAMALAAGRDRIACQYATDYADVFAIGVPSLAAARTAGVAPAWAATWTFMGFLAAFPDSHVARKFGAAVAERVRAEAAALAGAAMQRDTATLLAFDRRLKDAGINPGTTADLTVASLLAQACTSMLVDC
jgi:triphosphoribosyl-dephospho-CoA synthase